MSQIGAQILGEIVGSVSRGGGEFSILRQDRLCPAISQGPPPHQALMEMEEAPEDQIPEDAIPTTPISRMF
jgi:hypothetical protein